MVATSTPTGQVCPHGLHRHVPSLRKLQRYFPREPPRHEGGLTKRLCTFRPKSNPPAYQRYRDRRDLEKSYLNGWLRTTAAGDITAQQYRTNSSTFLYLLEYVKYHVAPLILRYIWYLIWKQLCVHVLYPVQKGLVRLDCRVDSIIAKWGNDGEEVGFALGAALSRFHGKMGLWKTLSYRWALLETGDLSAWKAHCYVPESKFYVPKTTLGDGGDDDVELAFYHDQELDYGCLQPQPF